MSPRRGLGSLSLEIRERTERAQSVTDESLPKPRPRIKPLPQRRAVSVHEDVLRDHIPLLAEELKAALPRLQQRSPNRKRANLGDLPPCREHPPEGREEGGVGGKEGEKETEDRKTQKSTEGETTDSGPFPEGDTGTGTGATLGPTAGPTLGLSPGLEKGSALDEVREDQDNSTQERGETVSQQHKAKSEPSDQRTEPPLSADRHMD